ncbi:MAG: Mut7-C RNAse domain-containing protein [Nitrospirota bacterium]
MKFIADAMLGRLAKWLRLLGFDVLYYPDIDDRMLIRIAREQDRTVLTRDTRLLRNKGIRDYIFIKSDNIFEQLSEMKIRLDFAHSELFGRCIVCNGILSDVSGKEDIREYVPDFIYHNHNDFIKCINCGKVYWKGTHHRNIKEKIIRILSDSADSPRRQ